VAAALAGDENAKFLAGIAPGQLEAALIFLNVPLPVSRLAIDVAAALVDAGVAGPFEPGRLIDLRSDIGDPVGWTGQPQGEGEGGVSSTQGSRAGQMGRD
jgi:hypothetical protein